MSTAAAPVLNSSTKSLPAPASDSTSLMTTAPDADEAAASIGSMRARHRSNALIGARHAVFNVSSLLWGRHALSRTEYGPTYVGSALRASSQRAWDAAGAANAR